MQHIRLILGVAMIIAVTSACAHTAPTGAARTVRTVEISNQVNPHVMYASPGEEVRWTNTRQNAVRVGFLTMRLMEDHQCEKGIVDMFGQMNDHVIIEPGDSISLCPAKTGDLQYNVWFDPEDPRGAISPTLTIKIRGG
jgi:plastocyanin